MSAKFGPAGNAQSFPYKSSADAPRWLREIGLDCYEYQCGKGVNVGEATARKIGLAAMEQGISLSLHAPYFINLANPDPESLQKTVGYITSACLAADWMGATHVIIHSGALMKRSRREAQEIALRSIREVVRACDDAGFAHITLCPETMGKINQLGDLDEVLELCTVDERLTPCVDFGHLYARSLGVDGSGQVVSTAIFLELNLRPMGEKNVTVPLLTTAATAPIGYLWPPKWPGEAGDPPLSVSLPEPRRRTR